MNLTRFSSSLAASTLLVAVAAQGQDTNLTSSGYFSDWFARVSRIQSEQPHWITPITTVTPRLEEELRFDQSWETSDNGSRTTTSGGKGLELIPWDNVEIILGIPAWVSHSRPAGEDGFGDESFLVKYRIAAANEENGNYILTAFLQLQVPTGSEHNSSEHYTVTPTIAGGKGWGDFDIQATAGLSLPDNGTVRTGMGTPLNINTALQYRLIKVLWPEVEFNYTYWPNGEHLGKEQVFMTPGFIVGRLPIWERVGMTIGLGYQFALTDNPTFNHNFIVSARIPF
jgi:hypothetical protein